MIGSLNRLPNWMPLSKDTCRSPKNRRSLSDLSNLIRKLRLWDCFGFEELLPLKRTETFSTVTSRHRKDAGTSMSSGNAASMRFRSLSAMRQVNRLDLVRLVERGHGLVVGKATPGRLRFRRRGRLRTGERAARGHQYGAQPQNLRSHEWPLSWRPFDPDVARQRALYPAICARGSREDMVELRFAGRRRCLVGGAGIRRGHHTFSHIFNRRRP